MTIAWWAVCLYGAGCASFGYVAGSRGWNPAGWVLARWRRWRNPPRPATTTSSLDSILREHYTLAYRDELLARVHSPIPFGQPKVWTGPTRGQWIVPIYPPNLPPNETP